MRTMILVCILALIGVGAADTASAVDADADSASSEESFFRICVPMTDVGPIVECFIELA